jgi:predicted phosphoribosyltransferase
MQYFDAHRAPRFHDRREAGKVLGKALIKFAGEPDLVVLALPRGGVPVGYEVAQALDAPLDVFIVRKLGAPWSPELAIGAVASGGVRVLDETLIRAAQVSRDELDGIIAQELAEIERREALYRGTRPLVDVAGRTVILVDDGLATGATMRAAVEAMRRLGPTRVIAAAPVGSRSACIMMNRVADACLCASTPDPFYGVGQWYEDFDQTTDSEVISLLALANSHSGSTSETRGAHR